MGKGDMTMGRWIPIGFLKYHAFLAVTMCDNSYGYDECDLEICIMNAITALQENT
jgi:hypothetical protein